MSRPSPPTSERDDPPPSRQQADPSRWRLADDATVVLSLLLVAVAAVVGVRLLADGVKLVLPLPPIIGWFAPHVGPGTVPAVLVVVAVLVARRRAARGPGRPPTPWRRLLLLGWVTHLVWMVSLTLVDGFRRGLADKLSDPNEYLHDLPLITSGTGFVATFADHIAYPRLSNPAGMVALEPSWTTHVAGHPPLATLVFWWWQEIGLPGSFWAAVLCMLVGSAVAVALPVTLRALGAPQAARRSVPFVALFPGAVWMGVSADGLFAGVATTGLAMVAVGSSARSRWHLLTAFGGGVLLGAALYLSYGLVLFGVVVLAVLGLSLWRAADRRRVLLRWGAAVLGVLATATPFTLLGFWWFDGLQRLHVRYYQGIATDRPYSYFIWANLAALVVMASPMLVVALRRAVLVLVRWRPRVAQDRETLVVAVVAGAGLLAVLLANVSGLSKAETERIWLPFAVVCWVSATLLRGRAATLALAGGAVWALMVNHLLYTGW